MKPAAPTRRTFLKTGAAAALGAVSLNPAARPANARRPNILLIITDQQNIDAVSAYRNHFSHPAYGCHHVSTPHLDRLASRGMSFLESHAASPLCSPARSSIFTGRMPSETGVLRNNMGIDARLPTLGQWLEAYTGYARVYCGKWHAGGPWNYPEPTRKRPVPGFDIVPAGIGFTGAEADYAISTSMAGFLREYRARAPFFAVASFVNPHDIVYWTDPLAGRLLTPEEDVLRMGEALPPLPPNFNYTYEEPEDFRYTQFSEERWRNYCHDYYRLVETVDLEIGRVLDAIEDRDDETVIIFTTDHGEGLGRHRRVGKNYPFESSVKVPLMISCPGRIAEGVVDTTHLVSGVDLASTICEFAGAAPPPLARGHSLGPLLTNAAPEAWRDHLYMEVRAVGRLIRTQQYKYARFYEHSGDWEKPFVRTSGAPARFYPGQRAQYRQNPRRLLFDIQADPWELTNLAGDPKYAAVIDEHEKLVEAWELQLIPGFEFSRA